jgi:hypothetical protein
MPSASAKKAYEELYKTEHSASNVKVLEVLFHGGENESCCKQRKHKPYSILLSPEVILSEKFHSVIYKDAILNKMQ